MANRKVILVRRCKTDGGWRYYPVVMGKNGKVKPGFVLVKGIERYYPEGHYALRTYVGDQIVYEKLTDHASDAKDARDRALHLVTAKSSALAAGAVIVTEPGRKNLRSEYKKFLQATEDRGSMEAADVYRLAIDEFLQVIGKTYVDEITPEEITKFHKALQNRGMVARTVSNRHNSVRAFMIYLKLDHKDMPKPPRFVKTMPEIYTLEEMTSFFAAIDASKDFKLKVMFETYLQTGVREREAMHLEWPNIVRGAKPVLQLRSKVKRYGPKAKLKDHEERDLALSGDLLEMFAKYQTDYPFQTPLLFGKDERGGRPGDKPDGHMLRSLKQFVYKVGLNCGNCEGCLGTKECEKWYLHKFRSTFCTQMWRETHDMVAVMKAMGHSDLETTMNYIRPAEGEIMQTAVNRIKWH
jgi:integrase